LKKLSLVFGRLDFVKSFHFHLYYSGYIRTSWSACGQANVLHGLLEFAKLLKIVQNVAFSFCKHQIEVLHDILFEPIKSQKFRIKDFNVWIIGVEM
jgi:hypothetical protein